MLSVRKIIKKIIKGILGLVILICFANCISFVKLGVELQVGKKILTDAYVEDVICPGGEIIGSYTDLNGKSHENVFLGYSGPFYEDWRSAHERYIGNRIIIIYSTDNTYAKWFSAKRIVRYAFSVFVLIITSVFFMYKSWTYKRKLLRENKNNLEIGQNKEESESS